MIEWEFFFWDVDCNWDVDFGVMFMVFYGWNFVFKLVVIVLFWCKSLFRMDYKRCVVVEGFLVCKCLKD